MSEVPEANPSATKGKPIASVSMDRGAGMADNAAGRANCATDRDMPPGPNWQGMENPGRKPDAIV